jgi:hypothetical protein
MLGQATGMAGNLTAVAGGGHDPVKIGRHVDPDAVRGRVDRVVAGVEANVVVPRQPQPGMPGHIGQHRRQRPRRGPILNQAAGR